MKTRLGKDLGHPQAVEVYKKLLAITRSAALEVEAQRQLWYGDFVNTEDDWLPQSFEKKLQSGDSLGERMHRAFSQGFESGYKKVVIIGSDCPEMNARLLEEAFEVLNEKEAVIGPANDGGYYLLGLSRPVNIFADIEWSTKSVFHETLKQMEKLKLSYQVMEEKTDLDTVDDLKKFPWL